MTNDGVWTYTYDKDGNMTEKSMGASATTWFYKYDNLGHMTSATEYSAATGGTLQAQTTFVFDALNNRVEQDEWTSSTGTVVTRFSYDGQNVWADLNGSNALQDRRLYLDETGPGRSGGRNGIGSSRGWPGGSLARPFFVDRKTPVRNRRGVYVGAFRQHTFLRNPHQ
jgi:hypothetical protein